MFMACIFGYTEIRSFSEDEEKAKKLALKKKKSLCRDDLERWTWETVTDYYGATVEEIKDGLIITN